MPAWVLLLTKDSLRATALEEEIRLGGFSPRRAPDAERGRVLLRGAEPPAAIVVDLRGASDDAAAALGRLAGGAPIVRLIDRDGGMETSPPAAHTVIGPPGCGALARRLATLGKQ